jgi:Tol biopolymer transport system component
LTIVAILTAALAFWGVEAAADTTERVSVDSDGAEGNGESFTAPWISADGRFVAFASLASNLVTGDTNGVQDVFVHDWQTGMTERVSVGSDGAGGNGESDLIPAISADGRFVAFASLASNLVAGDTNGIQDIFVHDRGTGLTERVSVRSDGTQANATSEDPAISADGRFVAFQSFASNLVAGDPISVPQRVFVHDRQTGITERVSVSSDGTVASATSGAPAISADGRFVAFSSFARNLVPDDTDFFADIFVHDRETGITERVSLSSAGVEGNGGSEGKNAISTDGRFVAFASRANNLVTDDTNDA